MEQDRSSKAVSTENRRVLVVDDMRSIHADFAKILGRAIPNRLQELEMSLFGEEVFPNASPGYEFELDFVSQGVEGVARARRAVEENRPYALAFVDVRMPPGADGIDTIQKIWEIDPRLEIVVCTAYSDYTWQQMIERLTRKGQFLVLAKPFDGTAVRQMALALTEKWNLARQAERTRADLDRLVETKTEQINRANAAIQAQMNERMDLEKRLLHAQKLEALGRLVAGVAHEINNPLSFVLANLDLISKEICLAEPITSERAGELRDAAEEAQMGAKRIQQIVRDLTNFGSPEPVAMADVSIQDVMSFALRMAKPSFPPKIKVNTSFEKVPTLRSNSGMLSQVFLNLLVNAGHALRGVPPERQNLEASIKFGSDECVVITVRDTGIGIPEEIMPRIFDPFFTTRPPGEGTGLGLPVCHGIVQKLGGEIRIESRQGAGTSAFVYLPIVAPAGGFAPERAA